MYQRIRWSASVAEGAATSVRPDRWRQWASLAAPAQVDAVIAAILGGYAAPETRELMLATASATDGSERLRQLLGVALASAEFQRR
jgi:hypothetical protein